MINIQDLIIKMQSMGFSQESIKLVIESRIVKLFGQ